jgi:phage tail protein X
MSRTVRAEQNDTLDALVFRHLGRTDGGLVEQTLALNRGLAAGGIVLSEGAPVTLPSASDVAQGAARKTVQLWD